MFNLIVTKKVDININYEYNIRVKKELEVLFMKRTFQPNNHKMKKKHGFFARKLAGTDVINQRRAKGRKKLSA